MTRRRIIIDTDMLAAVSKVVDKMLTDEEFARKHSELRRAIGHVKAANDSLDRAAVTFAKTHEGKIDESNLRHRFGIEESQASLLMARLANAGIVSRDRITSDDVLDKLRPLDEVTRDDLRARVRRLEGRLKRLVALGRSAKKIA